MSLKIGSIALKNKVFLAPMAGMTSFAYIKICEEMGVAYAVTELISAEAIVRNNQKTLAMLNGLDKIKIPVAVQIFGSNPTTMAKSAKILVDNYHAQIIDINMGCPVNKVALRSNAGSALLKSPDKVYQIVKEVVNNVNVPITVKIRSGWDENSINAVEIAQIIEKAGAKAIAVHARTRAQGYSGKSNWQIIKQVKESVSIPVIGNGDITSPFLAKEMIEQTGCDAIMIGRGSLGNPWLIKQCVEYLETGHFKTDIPNEEKIKMIKHHFTLLNEDKPLKETILEMRTNIMYYLKNMPNNKIVKQKICTCQTKEEIYHILDEYLKEIDT